MKRLRFIIIQSHDEKCHLSHGFGLAGTPVPDPVGNSMDRGICLHRYSFEIILHTHCAPQSPSLHAVHTFCWSLSLALFLEVTNVVI